MLCYVTSCHVVLCHVMLHYVNLCILRYVMICYVMICYVMLCHVMSCYVLLCTLSHGHMYLHTYMHTHTSYYRLPLIIQTHHTHSWRRIWITYVLCVCGDVQLKVSEL